MQTVKVWKRKKAEANKERRSDIMWGVITAIAIVILSYSLVAGGGKNAEAVECREWQAQGKVYPDYFLADWQVKQCEAVAPDTLTPDDYITD